MNYLPIFADIRNKLCLVVGGGAVAKRKASVLLEAGANVRLPPLFSFPNAECAQRYVNQNA